MSGVKELSGLHGPSFITSDIHFSSWAGYIPCLQLFLAGISQLCLLQNLRVLTVTQVSFSHFTQGPLTAASPLWAVTQGFPPVTCYLASVALRNHRTRIHGPFTLPSLTTLNPTPRVNIAKVPLPAWDEPSLS